jgi:hypothetical protein
MRRIRRTLGTIFVSVSLGLAAGAFVQTPVLVALLFGLIGQRLIWRQRSRAMHRALDASSSGMRRAA